MHGLFCLVRNAGWNLKEKNAAQEEINGDKKLIGHKLDISLNS